jgi:hypothetical protein
MARALSVRRSAPPESLLRTLRELGVVVDAIMGTTLKNVGRTDANTVGTTARKRPRRTALGVKPIQRRYWLRRIKSMRRIVSGFWLIQNFGPRNAAWDAANPDKVRAKHRRIKNTKYAESIEFRVTCAIRNGVNGAMRGKKFGRSLELIGCTVAELVSHIESQFRDGMTWDNWGKSETGGWELDHRKAIGLHNLTVREECFAAFHYSNLQPLLMDEHKRKTRLDHEAIRLQKRRSGSSAR